MKSNLVLREINMSSLGQYERDQIVDEISQDPLDLFIAKVDALADLLDCSEQAAEDIILSRVHRRTLSLTK